jgi:hypothetical protein
MLAKIAHRGIEELRRELRESFSPLQIEEIPD